MMATRTKRTRLLAALLCTLLVVLMLPTAGFAAEGKTVYLKNTGSDANDGSTAAQAVQTLDKALELAGKGGTILMGSQIWVNGEKTIENVTIARAEGYEGTMLSVSGGATLTVRNAVIDGKNGGGAGRYLLTANSNATVNIETGAVLENNAGTAVSVTGGTLNMKGGAIRNNQSPEDGGGVYLWDAKAVFSGGVIEGNETDRAGGGICALGASDVTIDGTVFRNNQSGRHGSGVYIEGSGSKDAVFVMKSGSIVDNLSTDRRGGLAIMAAQHNVDATLTGGTIQNNLNPDKENTAILLGTWSTEYPVLKVSGSPTIQGNIDLWDEGEIDKGAYLVVNGAFSPTEPLCISDIYSVEDRAVVRYAQGLTPDLNDFTTSFTSVALAVNGSNLVWVELVQIRVYTATDNGNWESHWVYVYPNRAIDPEKLPASITKTGYSMIGYQYQNEQGEWAMWDMSTPVAPTDDVRLYEAWVLDAPTAKIDASATRVHLGENIVLTAHASHALDNATYQYAWYKDGVQLQGADQKTLTVTEPGRYTVKISATVGSATSAQTESEAVVCEFGHFVDDAWQSDDHNHWQACTECGEKLNLGAHISDGGRVTTQATETTEGVKTYACTVCGKVLKTEAIPVLASPNGANGVKTGDLSQPVLWTVLLVLAAAGVGGTVLYRKRNHA